MTPEPIHLSPRPLPVFVLADTSGSMKGSKIQSLNLALRDMVQSFCDVDTLQVEIRMAVIAFGGSGASVSQPLMPAREIVLQELTAAGKTPMGAALDLLREQMEDPDVLPRRAYAPTVVLVSDGLPTDIAKDLVDNGGYQDWVPLRALHTSPRASGALRLAVAIGEDASLPMLEAFVNSSGIPIIQASDANGIARFFRMVTYSVTSRSLGPNPNQAEPFLADPFSDE